MRPDIAYAVYLQQTLYTRTLTDTHIPISRTDVWYAFINRIFILVFQRFLSYIALSRDTSRRVSPFQESIAIESLVPSANGENALPPYLAIISAPPNNKFTLRLRLRTFNNFYQCRRDTKKKYVSRILNLQFKRLIH